MRLFRVKGGSMNERQWRAAWYDPDLTYHEYLFYAPDNYFIARVDFRFKMLVQGKPVPEFFEIEEGPRAIRVIPSLKELVERGEL